jgi:hypothetical protein
VIEERYFIHVMPNSKLVRGLIIDNRAMFIAVDFCKAAGVTYPRAIKNRLCFSEMRFRAVDGHRMRLVDSSGLIGLVASGSQYSKARRYALELITISAGIKT